MSLGYVNDTYSCLHKCASQKRKSPTCINMKTHTLHLLWLLFFLHVFPFYPSVRRPASSVPLFNCIMKPFSYSSCSISEPSTPHPPSPSPLSPLLLVEINETAQALPLPLTLLILFALSVLAPAAFPLALSFSYCRPRLSVSLSVSAGQLACSHETFYLASKMSDDNQRAVIYFFFRL